MTNAGVQMCDEGIGMQELQNFLDFLPNHKITVYSYANKGRDVYFESDVSYPQYTKKNILFDAGHINVITNLKAAFSCGYFCKTCHVLLIIAVITMFGLLLCV